MPEPDTKPDSGGVQDAARPTEFEPTSSRRYTVEPDEPVDVAIVYAVAAAKGVDPMGLDQSLNEVVNADALQQLFASSDGTVSASFFLDGYRVTVLDGGRELIVSDQ